MLTKIQNFHIIYTEIYQQTLRMIIITQFIELICFKICQIFGNQLFFVLLNSIQFVVYSICQERIIKELGAKCLTAKLLELDKRMAMTTPSLENFST